MLCQAVWTILLFSSLQVIQCYNVLFLLPFGCGSHRNVFDPVAEQLAKRGHKVVLFNAVDEKKELSAVEIVVSKELMGLFDKVSPSFFEGTMTSLAVLNNVFKMIDKMAEITFQDPFIADIIKEPFDPTTNKPKYDVVVIDAVFSDFGLALAHHMGVPNVILSPTMHLHHQAWNLDVPFPLSYVPAPQSDFLEPMDFLNRAISSFWNVFYLVVVNYYHFPNQDRIIQKFLPNTPPLVELNRNVSFMMSNTHPAVQTRQPGMPYTAEVGGLHCHPAKPLPKELEDFMREAGTDGVIDFSLGAMTKGQSMPLDMRAKVIEAFSQIPQRILWKYEKEIPELPKNIKLVKWAPQQDVLGHSQLRLFITHGGGLSLSEAAYHGCPVLGFPLSADHLAHMAQAKSQGFGEYLNWRTFTSHEFLGQINNILSNKSYKERSMQASVLLKDRPQKPVETAAYWIEYVVRHNGAHFLKSSAAHLNLFQYFLLDILATFLGLLIAMGVVLYYLIKFSCRLVATMGHRIISVKSYPPKKADNRKKKN